MEEAIRQSSITLLSQHCRKELDLKNRSLTLYSSEEVACECGRVKASKVLIPGVMKPKIDSWLLLCMYIFCVL